MMATNKGKTACFEKRRTQSGYPFCKSDAESLARKKDLKFLELDPASVDSEEAFSAMEWISSYYFKSLTEVQFAKVERSVYFMIDLFSWSLYIFSLITNSIFVRKTMPSGILLDH